MKKKFKLVLALGCTALACAGFAACGPSTKVDENIEKGYKIIVTYDPNGGKYLDTEGVKLADMFKPDQYAVGSDGKVHIKLLEPTSPTRPSSSGSISLAHSGHFFAGWYQTREVVKDEDGSPVDADGEKLVETEEGTYVYASTVNDEKPKSATPAYTYSDYWDFEEDTVDYAEEDYEDGICEITLYAGWVPYYEFNYYYKMANDLDAEWTKLDKETTFDFTTVKEAAEGSAIADEDTIHIPEWPEDACTVNYSYRFASGASYSFPKVDGTTFLEAYSDPDRENKLTGEVEHLGSLAVADGERESLKVENRVQNIYIVLDEGERYRLSKAEDLAKNVNLNGIYEICADLDFTGVQWPVKFTEDEFKGKMYAAEGSAYTLRNITATHSNEKVKIGGLFGSIAAGAEIKNLSFENVTFDLAKANELNTDASFGLFAGLIDDEAIVSNVSVGGTFRLGEVSSSAGTTFNLWANGNTAGLTKNEVKIQVYGTERKLGANVDYNYTIDTDSVRVDASGAITFSRSVYNMITGVNTRYKSEQITDINYTITNTEVE